MAFDSAWVMPIVISIILSIVAIVNVILIAFNVKTRRDSLQLNRWTKMLQQSILRIEMLQGNWNNPQIILSNIGEVTIDEILTNIDISIQDHPNGLHLEHSRKTILFPEETCTIDLPSNLEQFLIDQDILNIHTIKDIPIGIYDPITGEEKIMDLKFKHISREFSMIVLLDICYKVHTEIKRLKKKFSIYHLFVPEYGDFANADDPECMYSDNYQLRIQEISGEWLSS